MSVDGTEVLFEGFLQKRKDTMKIRWATYWFRLQNTTLFFYTKKNGCASHLRGSYYIYAVQSVREVLRADSKRFKFEIIMTSGKRKLLAAETAAGRQEWVQHLWQAMRLSTSGVSWNTCQRDIRSPLPAGHIHHEVRSNTSHSYMSEELNNEESIYQNILPAFDNQQRRDLSSDGRSSAGTRDYDVLPIRKNPTENIYDVPSSLLRKMSAQTFAVSSEEELEDAPYWMT